MAVLLSWHSSIRSSKFLCLLPITRWCCWAKIWGHPKSKVCIFTVSYFSKKKVFSITQNHYIPFTNRLISSSVYKKIEFVFISKNIKAISHLQKKEVVFHLRIIYVSGNGETIAQKMLQSFLPPSQTRALKSRNIPTNFKCFF